MGREGSERRAYINVGMHLSMHSLAASLLGQGGGLMVGFTKRMTPRGGDLDTTHKLSVFLNACMVKYLYMYYGFSMVHSKGNPDIWYARFIVSRIYFHPSYHSLCCQNSAIEGCVGHARETSSASGQRMPLHGYRKGCPQ